MIDGYFGQVPNAELMDVADLFTFLGDNIDPASFEEVEREYQDRLHRFFADAFLLIQKEPEVERMLKPGGAVWLVYQQIEDGDEGPVSLMPRKDALLVVGTQMDNKPYPYVRIMTNEAFTREDGIDFFVEDVTVNPDGDAQQYFGVYPIRETPSVTTAPIFMMGEEPGSLIIYTLSGKLAPCVSLGDSGVARQIKPFGMHTCLADKLLALTFAQSQLNTFSKMPPFKTSADIF